MRTFHADPAIKAQALDRLRRHIAAGSFVYFPAWQDGNANAIGAVVEADDTPLYAETLGYPLALAEMLPMFVNGFLPLAEAARFAEAWLDRTPIGADLTGIVPQLIIELLGAPALTSVTARYPELERLRTDIIALHRQSLRAEAPDRKAWKAVRLSAVAATDRLEGSKVDRHAGQVVESAAWPGTMRTVLRDTLAGLSTFEMHLALAAIGWTEDDESRVFHIRQQAEIDGHLAELHGIERLLAILDADHSALAVQFRRRMNAMEESRQRYRSTGWRVIELMEGTPTAV